MRITSVLALVSAAALSACVADDTPEVTDDDAVINPDETEARSLACADDAADIDAPSTAGPFDVDRPTKLLDPGGQFETNEPDPQDPRADCELTGECTLRTAPAPIVCPRVAVDAL